MSPYLSFLNASVHRPWSRAQRRERSRQGLPLSAPTVVRSLDIDRVRAYLHYLDNPQYRAAFKPVAPASAAQAASFPSVPTPVVSIALVSEPAPRADVTRALVLVQQRFPDLWAIDNGMLFRRSLEQLLPLKRDVVQEWGRNTLQGVADLTESLARLTRAHIDLHGLDLLEKLLTDLRRPKNFLERIMNRDPAMTETQSTLSSLRVRIKPVQEACQAMVPKIKDLQHRGSVQLASLSFLAANDAALDGKIMQAIEEKTGMFQHSLTQASLLGPQIEALDGQIANVLARVDEALTITLPALEMARAHDVGRAFKA